MPYMDVNLVHVYNSGKLQRVPGEIVIELIKKNQKNLNNIITVKPV